MLDICRALVGLTRNERYTGGLIRAVYDDKTIRVYQAYGDDIADAALAHGTFVAPPFKMGRMTWIKPSFLWMMYRAAGATKMPAKNASLPSTSAVKALPGRWRIVVRAMPGRR